MLPKVAVEEELKRGALREIRVEGLSIPQREIAVIYRKGRPLSRAGEAFIELLEERYDVRALPKGTPRSAGGQQAAGG